MYNVERNEKKSENIGLYATRPNIPSAEQDIEEKNIMGRDGSIIEVNDTVKDIAINITFGFFGPKKTWGERFRTARKWLLEKIDDRLILQDDPEYYYRVKKTTINECERQAKEIGEFTVNFLCHGCQYLQEGQNEIEVIDCIHNEHYLSKPIYKIKGEGTCVIEINGKSFSVDVGQNATINTELMITYREDGEIMNAETVGDYENIYLTPGDNNINATEGFEVKIIPNWRCL